ncbi:nuclear transport factor 2 family protein [Marinicella sp. W31]|uniref:nuclear transport factor 2 family protein n=1 Tax=Marinicella sp. W31 TaxID=3023713 RepID=UPI0037573E26
MTPREIANLQLLAYNARDIDAFCALFDDQAELIDLPSSNTIATGIDEIRTFYEGRFSEPDLQCTVHAHSDIGNFAIDRETVYGLPDSPVDVVAMYEVIEDKIQRVFFIRHNN